MGASLVVLFIGTIAVGYLATPKPVHSQASVGLDFIAFYTAGTFVREGRERELYDISAFQRFQHDLAARQGVDLGSAVGPWWNPPFYVWVFVPISKLAYPTAILCWLLLNVACAGLAAWLLVRMLPANCGWRNWALVPVLMFISTPFLHSLSHGQNTGTSLLILSAAVVAWRADRAFLAGLAAGLLFYKPQLGAILAAVIVIDLGWKAAAGLGVTGAALLLITLFTLPGTLGDYLHRLPANVHFVQVMVPYMWERHVTLRAFWRLLLQGRGTGESTWRVTALTVTTTGALGTTLLAAAIRSRTSWRSCKLPRGTGFQPMRSDVQVLAPRHGTPLARVGNPCHIEIARVSRDRLIAATIACTPLLMPFFFDYDQLLLAVPAVLLASEWVRNESDASIQAIDRWVIRIWPLHFVWLMLNPDIAELTHVNLTVILLSALACLLVTRAWMMRTRSDEERGIETIRTLRAARIDRTNDGNGIGQTGQLMSIDTRLKRHGPEIQRWK